MLQVPQPVPLPEAERAGQDEVVVAVGLLEVLAVVEGAAVGDWELGEGAVFGDALPGAAVVELRESQARGEARRKSE